MIHTRGSNSLGQLFVLGLFNIQNYYFYQKLFLLYQWSKSIENIVNTLELFSTAFFQQTKSSILTAVQNTVMQPLLGKAKTTQKEQASVASVLKKRVITVRKLGRERRTEGVRALGLSQLFCSRPNFRAVRVRKKTGDTTGDINFATQTVINRKFTFMILSPVLRIPSWPAGPFSEIFEIKIPCKGQQKNIALHTATRVSPTILPILGTSLPPRRMTPTWKGREACLKIELNSWRPSYRTNDLLQPLSL